LNYVNLTWYEYDDQIVTEVDAQQVENCEAYVLFYRFLAFTRQTDEVLVDDCCISEPSESQPVSE